MGREGCGSAKPPWELGQIFLFGLVERGKLSLLISVPKTRSATNHPALIRSGAVFFIWPK